MKYVFTFLAVPMVALYFQYVPSNPPITNIVDSADLQQEGRMNKGTWGGNHISVEVTDEGARIEYDCAHGRITEPLKVDSQGRFSAKGTHVRERGGPVRADSEDQGEPVVYSGTTDGKTATLKVVSSATEEVIGTFTLTLGKKTRLMKCL